MKLLVSRFGLPVNHSGEKVMKPATLSRQCFGYSVHIDRSDSIDQDKPLKLTAVQLASRQHTSPKPQPARFVSPSHQLTDPQRQGSRTKHSQQLQADDRKIGPTPSLVCLGIFLPQLCRWTGTVLVAIKPVCIAEEVYARGGQGCWMRIVGAVGN